MKNLNRYTWLAVVLFSFTSAYSQWFSYLSFNNGYDDNAYHLTGKAALFMNSNAFMLGYIDSESGVGFSYLGDLNFYAQFPESNNNSHALNLSYVLPYGSEEKNTLSFLGGGSMKFYGEEMMFYNNNGGFLNAELKHYLGNSDALRAGSKSKLKSYTNYAEMSYFENDFFVGYRSFFETNTSINAELHLGVKDYLNNVGQAEQMQGRGKNQIELASNMEASLKIGQSLADYTGLSVTFAKSLLLNSSDRMSDFYNSNYYLERELYDDEFTYDKNEVQLMLTQVFPESYKAQAQLIYQDKNFSYPADLINYTGTERQDELFAASVSLSKVFNEVLIFRSLKLNLSYWYINNKSNSNFFDYTSNSVSFGIDFGIQ